MSTEHNLGTVYERGVELRKRTVLIFGSLARRSSELGADTDQMFNLGRGDFDDGNGPRTLSLELNNRVFSIRHAGARESAPGTHGIVTLRNQVPKVFSAAGNPVLRHEISYTSSGAVKSVLFNGDVRATW